MNPSLSRSAAVIRPLAKSDLVTARALWSTAEGVELAEGDSEVELVAYLDRNPGVSQAAFADGKLVGALLAGHDGRRGWLYHLAVDRAHRGAGLGRQLVERALSVLQAHGIRRTLILVARDNAAGRAFWTRCRWEPLEFAEPMGIDL